MEPLKPQSVMDLDAPEIVTFTPAQQDKVNEIIKRSMGRAASETRQELAAANAKVARLEAQLATLPATTPVQLQLEHKLISALARVAEHDAILAKAREGLLQTLAIIS
jgi:hypothetical protein